MTALQVVWVVGALALSLLVFAGWWLVAAYLALREAQRLIEEVERNMRRLRAGLRRGER